jgi:hypothetical protein
VRALIRLACDSDSSASATRITGRIGDTELAIHVSEVATWTWQPTRTRFGGESGRRLRVTPQGRDVLSKALVASAWALHLFRILSISLIQITILPHH